MQQNNPYLSHFQAQAKGLVTKNQDFYVVNPKGDVTANQVLEDRQEDSLRAPSLRRIEEAKKDQRW
jgi:hypothetical protein